MLNHIQHWSTYRWLDVDARPLPCECVLLGSSVEAVVPKRVESYFWFPGLLE
jgi:hypothetical protein